MNISEVAPTKTNLLDFKSQLGFSIDGHALLEEKREILVMQLVDIVSKIKEVRESINNLLARSYELLQIVSLEIGELELRNISDTQKELPEIEIHEKRVMGVSIPSIKYKEEIKTSARPDISFSSSTINFDMLSKQVKEIVKLIIVVAQVEDSAWKLAYEIKKTQRRVNALENIFIPEFREIIKFIQDTLEERERETFFQLKRIKNNQDASV
ncbi:MAG: V-type ATP synthase subunit D [Brevinematales bacterium]|jgi:V/A-type H+-transporting ATPase subunit D